MTVYANRNPDSPIRSMEWSEGDGRSFFHVKPGADGSGFAAFAAWAKQHGQRILDSQTEREGTQIFITVGDGSSQQLADRLTERGEFVPAQEKRKANLWAIRAGTSIVGQSLQIWSSFVSTGHKSDKRAVFGFGALNMAANAMNIIFGAQKKKDAHQLRFLKEQFNQELAPHMPGQALPDPQSERLGERPKADTHQTLGQKTYGFLQRYSVSGGEIGLRVIGSAMLAFPQPVAGLRALKNSKSLVEAYHAARNHNPRTFIVGLTMLTGKAVSLFSKEPDPYNPKPTGTIRRLRETVTFKASSVIEAGAAGYMAYDKYQHGRIQVTKNSPITRDYLNVAGNAAFIGGYAVRYFAPYGSLEVNMPELYAHISDSLALAPRDTLPGLAVQAAERLTQHFAEKKETFADHYTKLAADLREFHGIDLRMAAEKQPPMPETSPTESPKTRVHRAEAQPLTARQTVVGTAIR